MLKRLTPEDVLQLARSKKDYYARHNYIGEEHFNYKSQMTEQQKYPQKGKCKNYQTQIGGLVQWCTIPGTSWFRFRFQVNSKVWFRFRFQQEVHWFHSDSSPKTLIPVPIPIPIPAQFDFVDSDSDSSRNVTDSGINSDSGIGIVHH